MKALAQQGNRGEWCMLEAAKPTHCAFLARGGTVGARRGPRSGGRELPHEGLSPPASRPKSELVRRANDHFFVGSSSMLRVADYQRDAPRRLPGLTEALVTSSRYGRPLRKNGHPSRLREPMGDPDLLSCRRVAFPKRDNVTWLLGPHPKRAPSSRYQLSRQHSRGLMQSRLNMIIGTRSFPAPSSSPTTTATVSGRRGEF